MGVMQVAGCALLCAVAILLLRELRPALAPPARLAATLLLTGAAFALYAPILGRINALVAITDAATYASIILRALGIALICELCAQLCRDLGEGGLAVGVSLFGRLEILLLSLPLIDQILEIAKELLEF